jgi:hypothetical protein
MIAPSAARRLQDSITTPGGAASRASAHRSKSCSPWLAVVRYLGAGTQHLVLTEFYRQSKDACLFAVLASADDAGCMAKPRLIIGLIGAAAPTGE